MELRIGVAPSAVVRGRPARRGSGDFPFRALDTQRSEVANAGIAGVAQIRITLLHSEAVRAQAPVGQGQVPQRC